MNKSQENELSMAVAVQALLKDFTSIAATIPAFAQSVTDLSNEIANIKGLALVQEKYSNATGATSKQEAEHTAINLAIELASATRAYASKAGNTSLYESLNYTPSGLKHLRDSDTLTAIIAIRDIVQANLPVLTDWNVTSADVDLLTSQISALEILEQAPRKAQSALSAATDEMPNAFAKQRKVLDELDGHLGRLKSKQPMFFSAYQTARIIVDNKGGGKNGGTKNPGTDDEPDEPKPDGPKQ